MKDNASLQTNQMAMRSQHRHFVIFSGERLQIIEQVRRLTGRMSSLWITDLAVKGVELTVLPEKVSSLLGQETTALVYDTFTGFNLDALGISTGLVRGGGYIILLTPDFSNWPLWHDPEYKRILGVDFLEKPSYFISRTIRLIEEYPHITVIKQSKPGRIFLPVLSDTLSRTTSKNIFACDFGAITPDQAKATRAIITCCQQKGNSALILTANRGRGKTSALGLAAACLLGGKKKITLLVTAPRFATVKPLFFHLQQQLKKNSYDIQCAPGQVAISDMASLNFIAPDTLCLSRPSADALFVDEAASIPVPLLEKWLDYYPHIIFSSTLHGYEGAGRGFGVRFMDILKRKQPRYTHYHIKTPIRWAENDPSEQFIFRLLGLDSKPVSNEKALKVFHEQNYRYAIYSGKELACEKTLLSQIFGLLAQSHYQTRPSNLRQLLDGPDMTVHTLLGHLDNTVIAVAIVSLENAISKNIHNAIFTGKKRLKGHLINQLLATQGNALTALSCKSARIQRIAVHPVLRHRGIGSLFLSKMMQVFCETDIDLIGSNFGATTDLLKFWIKNGLTPVNLGSKRDASSACHAVTVLRPMTQKGSEVKQASRQYFTRNLPFLLMSSLREIDPLLAIKLMEHGQDNNDPPLSAGEKRVIDAYANGYYLYDPAIYLLHKATRLFFRSTSPASLSTEKQTLLAIKILQNHSWPECAKRMNYTGKKMTEKNLRSAFQQILEIF